MNAKKEVVDWLSISCIDEKALKNILGLKNLPCIFTSKEYEFGVSGKKMYSLHCVNE